MLGRLTARPPSHSQPSSLGSSSSRGFSSRSKASSGLYIPPSVLSKVGRNLHLQDHHPIRIVKDRIHKYFDDTYKLEDGVTPEFNTFDNIPPKVTTEQCFDELLIPKDHVSRSPSDTFYFDSETLLRTHTSAHQSQLIRDGNTSFLATGDCYRRDTIDRYHFPIFHQMEGVRLFPNPNPGLRPDPDNTQVILDDLKNTLEGLVKALFGDVEMRWNPDYFPFTDPSVELEIFYNGDWMEVLGSGVMQQSILNACGRPELSGWAFGVGLERIAMALFDIPDIRLFWTEDERFLNQFLDGAEGVKYKPFSKHPAVYKDLSFWLGQHFHENDFATLVREYGGDDLVEEIVLIDQFTHPKSNRESRCYRITYRSISRTLTNDEIDALQEKLRIAAPKHLDLELR